MLGNADKFIGAFIAHLGAPTAMHAVGSDREHCNLR
jgi:hypothetical protein